jgi:hypothetical protein
VKKLIIIGTVIMALVLGLTLPVAAADRTVDPPAVRADVPPGASLIVEKEVHLPPLPPRTEIKPIVRCHPDMLEIVFVPETQQTEGPNQPMVRFREIITVPPDAEVCQTIECVVIFIAVTPDGEEVHIGEQLVAIHVAPPIMWCLESVNPHGKKVPPAGSTTPPGLKGGQNEDGFYEVQWPLHLIRLQILPRMMWAGTIDKPMAVPLPPRLLRAIINPGVDVVIKLTEAPGASPSIKKMGSDNGKADAVLRHITLPGDLLLTAMVPVPGGVLLVHTACLVPPHPK